MIIQVNDSLYINTDFIVSIRKAKLRESSTWALLIFGSNGSCYWNLQGSKEWIDRLLNRMGCPDLVTDEIPNLYEARER